jgi:hypothetical protein
MFATATAAGFHTSYLNTGKEQAGFRVGDLGIGERTRKADIPTEDLGPLFTKQNLRHPVTRSV